VGRRAPAGPPKAEADASADPRAQRAALIWSAARFGNQGTIEVDITGRRDLRGRLRWCAPPLCSGMRHTMEKRHDLGLFRIRSITSAPVVITGRSSCR
jgi:hypothetical protein